MRKIHDEIFMGNGKHSLAEVYKLHRKVEKAITILGGLQQPGHPDSEERVQNEERVREQMERELRNTILDIAVGLGLKRFLKTLP